MKLSQRLTLIFITFTAVPLVVIYLVYARQVQRHLDRLARVRIEASLTSVSTQMNMEKDRLSRLLRTFSRRRFFKESLILAQEDSPYFDHLLLIRTTLEAAAGPGLDELMVITPRGEVLSRASDEYRYGDSVGERLFFREAMGGRPVVHLQSGAGGGLFVRASGPVRYRGKAVGVMSLGFFTDKDLLRGLSRATEARLLITDGKRPLAYSGGFNGQSAQKLLRAYRAAPLRGKNSPLLKVYLEGEPYLFASAPLMGSDRYRLLVGASDKERQQMSQQLQTLLILLLAGVSVTGAVLGPLAAGRVLRPIGDLVQGAKALEQGDLDYRVKAHVSSKDLNTLVDTFNNMAESLKANQQALVEAERRSAWREIGVRIAHEIKNPLTPIQITLQSLLRSFQRKDADFGEHLEDGVNTILKEVDRLRHLASAFADFSRMPSPTPRPVLISQLLEKAMALYNHPPKDVTVTLKVERDATLNLDEEQIHAVIVNLVNNALDALKEHPPVGGGKVEVMASQGTRLVGDTPQEMAVIVVSDNGPGLTEAVRQKVFDPYFTTKKTGTGLGLAIAKRIVSDHGGTIEAQGEPGQGCTFRVYLPMSFKTMGQE